jgi:hypothetical protein
MSDLILSEEAKQEEAWEQPPLFLQHYLDERQGQCQVDKPPGSARTARIVERRENVIVVEFRDGTASKPQAKRPRSRRGFRLSVWDAAMLFLLLVTAGACVASLMR